MSRGRIWFKALSGSNGAQPDGPASLLVADAELGAEKVSYLAVAPDDQARFPRARGGEVGVEEGWYGARALRRIIEADCDRTKRPILTIVDAKSQAYGLREELIGIHLAAAGLIAAYAEARMAGHPVIALIVGRAVSASFLVLCGQANRVLALDDPQVLVHAMYKDAAARITRRTVEELDALGETIVPMAYDIRSFDKLGGLYRLLHVAAPDAPPSESIEHVKSALVDAIADARRGPRDLSSRLDSQGAQQYRKASLAVRAKMAEQWTAL
ncbi:MAG TPA: biotin-independent malonate decarboxylase subunit gamma [Terracidiphilus sp.]|jgi:malonate decarboxylase gamma subunit|nr:biotin-independent malonate decarboxylase subunit gamma [Terracidiphilus sp.]